MYCRVLVGLLVMAVALFAGLESHGHGHGHGHGRGPGPEHWQGCNCTLYTCTEPTISQENCTQLNGTVLQSRCGCCDGCISIVGDGEFCNVTLGDFPYPTCNSTQDLVCIDGFCRPNNMTT